MNIIKSQKSLYQSQNMVFSALSGYNYYLIPEDVPTFRLKEAVHAQSGQMVYFKQAEASESSFSDRRISWYRQYIMKPLPAKYSEWPSDIVECQTDHRSHLLYYVFPQRAFPGYIPIQKLMYQKKDSPVLDWRQPFISQVCQSFLKVMCDMEKSGYHYLDFSTERILYHEQTGAILLRHTPEIRRISVRRHDLFSAEVNHLATEFIPPCLYSSDYDGHVPYDAEYFSIAAILFRLMIGRLPYEGTGLSVYGDVFDPIRDRDPLAHKNYFVHYHEYPHFIFDEQDDSNHLGPMVENDLPRERWAALPDRIQNMFRRSLCQQTAQTLNPDDLFSASQWLDACTRLCWKNP